MQTIGHTGALAGAAFLAMSTIATAQNAPMPRHEPGVMGGRMEAQMQGMMQEMQGMMHDMMAIHAYAPDELLDRRADLSLTADQVKALEGLATEVKTAKAHAKSEHDVRHARIVAEFKVPRPDPAKVKADAQEAMQDMGAAHGIELSAMARAKGLLTDAQRDKVTAWVAGHDSKTKKPGAGIGKDKNEEHSGHHQEGT
jgi:hypothetical protein